MNKWEKLLSDKRDNQTNQQNQQNQKNQLRSNFQRDFDRLIFTYSFRRLNDKTQVHTLPDSDYVRTRLTHSLEVSSVGRSLGVQVFRDCLADKNFISSADFSSIVAAACLAHDIGNPPFGHDGEAAIREWIKSPNCKLFAGIHNQNQRNDFLNFDGNAQGLRIITDLEKHNGNDGLSLTYATLATFVKYPSGSKYMSQNDINKRPGKYKKFGIFDSELAKYQQIAEHLGLKKLNDKNDVWQRHPLVYLVEAADDICYLVIDLEDAARLKIISTSIAKNFLEDLLKLDQNFVNLNLANDYEQLDFLRSKAINFLIANAAKNFIANENSLLNGEYEKSTLFDENINLWMQQVRKFSAENIYENAKAIKTDIMAFQILEELLTLFDNACYEFLQNKKQNKNDKISRKKYLILQVLPERFRPQENDDEYSCLQKILDFISGLTDFGAVKLYKELTAKILT